MISADPLKGSNMYKILMIEDDFSLANVMKKQIELWGNEVMCITDFRNVVPAFIEYDPHLVLLDIMLPFFNGYHWCTEIRKISNVPIMFLSSASDNMNIIMAMNMGGDDFISKPVDLGVMISKIQAVLRRTYDMGDKISVLEHKGAVLNLNDTSLTFQGERIELTKNDFRILQTLLENKGKVVSRDTLMTKLWQIDAYVEENTLTVNVNRLRKKLENVGLHDFITTKIGCGYIIE
jgi:DNA-binding response OmpR family regulator